MLSDISDFLQTHCEAAHFADKFGGVSDMPTAAAGDARYHLRTFGTVAVIGPGGETVLGKHGHHRRRLALLASLAASGEQGRSRDELHLLFWPDAKQSRARHSLDQLLYALRGVLGDDAFANANPVRLNAAVVTTDVGQFMAALRDGDDEAAVSRYRGPFLAGFHLSDAAEFEEWLEAERSILSRQYIDALKRLAQSADSARDQVSSLHWWRKLAEADPLSSTIATGLIRSLMNSGDHAAALQYAERYEAVVQQELGTSVGPAVASLVAEVRAEAQTESVVARPDATILDRTPTIDLPLGRVSTSMPSQAGRRALRPTRAVMSGAVALVLLTSAAWLKTARGNGAERISPEQSLAVLPFENVGGSASDAPIVDGLTDEFISELSRIQGLRVIGRTSSFVFKNSTATARQIGDSLRVRYLVEGSIQESGEQLRVRVRLVDTRTGSAQWSETYDRRTEDVFSVQREIASSVARALHLQLGGDVVATARRRPTTSHAAYEFYLRGNDPVHLRTPEGPRTALAMLQQAVALDSNFAAAYAAMPRWYLMLSSSVETAREAAELRGLGKAMARKAWAIDSTLPESHLARGVSVSIDLSDLPLAVASARKALELGGAPRAREQLTRALMWSGRHAEALDEAFRAAADDPLAPTAAANVAEALCIAGRIDEGLARLTPLESVQPPLPRLRANRALCHAMRGDWARVAKEAPDRGVAPELGDYAVARSGDTVQARLRIAEAMDRWRRTGRTAGRVAMIYAGLGDLDSAFVWLQRGEPDRSGYSTVMYPMFASLHADPRFDRIRRSLGLVKP